MDIIGIIPSRYGSTRFKGKPLIDLMGKSMIQHVVEQCQKASSLNDVIVATDDERIKQAVNQFGGKVMMTSSLHNSGTERCIECYNKLLKKPEYIINIQGDEPLIHPEQIDQMGEYILTHKPDILTLARPIQNELEYQSPNVVKVVVNSESKALYFSRSLIPYARNKRTIPVLQHVGIYAYSKKALLAINKMKISELELIEGLEQLRWLDYGLSIHVLNTPYETIAIDKPEDVPKVIQQMKNGNT